MYNTKDTPIDYKQFEGHTPGPWKVRTKEEFELTNDLYHSIRAINGPSFDEPGFDITGCISWIDASLIAAAPDLLKENQELKLGLQKLQNDLDDALSIKNGKGPTAVYIASLRGELQKQKELNAELVNWIKEMPYEWAISELYWGSPAHEKAESLIKKSNEI